MTFDLSVDLSTITNLFFLSMTKLLFSLNDFFLQLFRQALSPFAKVTENNTENVCSWGDDVFGAVQFYFLGGGFIRSGIFYVSFCLGSLKMCLYTTFETIKVFLELKPVII